MRTIADALSAAGLLLAMIALIFGAWWPQLAKAADFSFADSKPNRKEQRGPIYATLFGQAVPLAIGAFCAALIFLPRALGLIEEAMACGCFELNRLDDVAAAFVVSEALLILIACAALVQLGRIVCNVVGSHF